MTLPQSGAKAGLPAGEIHVVVAVLTFRRPEGIVKLLESLTRQIKRPERPYRMTVLVVDNDPAGSSRAVVEAFATSTVFSLIYVIEPEPGIPFARNRAMDAAPADTDQFCFLDDDEEAVEGWLDAMLKVRQQTGADCVYGPVEPVYPENPPQYFVRSGVFEQKKHADGEQIGYAASNNVMFDYKRFRALNLRFEEKMRYTGGTDFLFFNQAVRKGIRIFWADDALVNDIIPASRMTWKWVLMRQYRLGNTFAVSETLHGTRQSRLYRLGYGILRVGLGVVMMPAILFSPKWGMRALVHTLRGAGVVSGILGHAYEEYRPGADGKTT